MVFVSESCPCSTSIVYLYSAVYNMKFVRHTSYCVYNHDAQLRTPPSILNAPRTGLRLSVFHVFPCLVMDILRSAISDHLELKTV